MMVEMIMAGIAAINSLTRNTTSDMNGICTSTTVTALLESLIHCLLGVK